MAEWVEVAQCVGNLTEWGVEGRKIADALLCDRLHGDCATGVELMRHAFECVSAAVVDVAAAL